MRMRMKGQGSPKETRYNRFIVIANLRKNGKGMNSYVYILTQIGHFELKIEHL